MDARTPASGRFDPAQRSPISAADLSAVAAAAVSRDLIPACTTDVRGITATNDRADRFEREKLYEKKKKKQRSENVNNPVRGKVYARSVTQARRIPLCVTEYDIVTLYHTSRMPSDAVQGVRRVSLYQRRKRRRARVVSFRFRSANVSVRFSTARGPKTVLKGILES